MNALQQHKILLFDFRFQKINEKQQVVNEYESGKAIPNNAVMSKLERNLGMYIDDPISDANSSVVSSKFSISSLNAVKLVPNTRVYRALHFEK